MNRFQKEILIGLIDRELEGIYESEYDKAKDKYSSKEFKELADELKEIREQLEK